MENTIKQLRNEVDDRGFNLDKLLDDNKKLFAQNENMKRILSLYKDKIDSDCQDIDYSGLQGQGNTGYNKNTDGKKL